MGSDRFSCYLFIGGPIPLALTDKLVDHLSAQGPTQEVELLENEILGLEYEDCRSGRVTDLEEWLVKHKIHFDLNNTGSRDYDGQSVKYRGVGVPEEFRMSRDGDLLWTAEELTQLGLTTEELYTGGVPDLAPVSFKAGIPEEAMEVIRKGICSAMEHMVGDPPTEGVALVVLRAHFGVQGYCLDVETGELISAHTGLRVGVVDLESVRITEGGAEDGDERLLREERQNAETERFLRDERDRKNKQDRAFWRAMGWNR